MTPQERVTRAAAIIAALYQMRFSGKRMGRLTLTREQVGDALDVRRVHDTTIDLLVAELIEDGYMMGNTGIRDLFAVVSARKAAAWRRVPKADFWEAVRQVDPDAAPADEEPPSDEDDE